MLGKTLFVTCFDISKNSRIGGGEQCSRRNYNALCSIFGEDNVENINLYDNYIGNKFVHKLIKRYNLFLGRYFGLSAKNEKLILSKCKDKKYLFIDMISYGRIAKIVKKGYPTIKIISFCHNIESDYIRMQFRINFIHYYCIVMNEKWACKYSDSIIALNVRDKNRFEYLYKRQINTIIGISFPNRQIEFIRKQISQVPTALFLGQNFLPNTHGIRWFIKNVLPFVNIKLKVVGRNMDKANLPQNEKLEVIGYVENLDLYIQNADFMIFPIFKGCGMKVKTCEALMHGKNIIGTNEAFCGYDVDFNKVGACCKTAEEFITAINEFPKRFNSKFNQYSRDLFVEKYSDEKVFNLFADLFRKLNGCNAVYAGIPVKKIRENIFWEI